MDTINRVAESVNGTQEKQEEPIPIEEQSRRAHAVLESLRQSRVITVEQELQALLKRHNASLEVRQMIIGGMPQPTQIAVVLNPER
jgi:hypothetical protein